MKRGLGIAFFATLFLHLTLLPAPQDMQLKLAVRAINTNSADTLFKAEDFQLSINSNPREIQRLDLCHKSLSQKSDLGRSFVLSFHLTEYGSHVENGLSYFLFEILDTSDQLIILSPIRAYQMTVTPNKEKLRKEIEEILIQDSKEYQKQRSSAENQLKSRINSLKTTLRDAEGVTQYKKVVQFFNTFAAEYVSFKQTFLIPHINGYQPILDALGEGEGERWWIHFQQKEIISLFARLKEINRLLNDYASNLESEHQDLGQVINTGHVQMQNTMHSSDSFPAQRLINIMLRNNVNYNVILFRSFANKDVIEAHPIWSKLEGTLKGITKAAGGVTVDTLDSREGMRQIEHHQDVWYDLVYAWDGKVVDKNIRLHTTKENVDLSYNQNLPKAQMDSMVKFLSSYKIKIDTLTVDNRTLSFLVSSFEINNTEGFGLIKIRIEILDDAGSPEFQTENTLRASKKEINTSLPIGDRLQNAHMLRITACDLIANRKTAVEHFFKSR